MNRKVQHNDKESTNNTVMQNLREDDNKPVKIMPENNKQYIELLKMELENNLKWSMEIKKKVGLQAIFWPFVFFLSLLGGMSIESITLETDLFNYKMAFLCLLIIFAFTFLGLFYGHVERRLWERCQNLRRLLMNAIAEPENSQKKIITFGCLAENDYKYFDTRGGYVIHYLLISILAISTFSLVVLSLNPSEKNYINPSQVTENVFPSHDVGRQGKH